MKKIFAGLFLFLIFSQCAFSSDLLGLQNDALIEDYIDMARLYTSSAQYEKALDYIKIIEKLSPNNPKIMYEKAVILKNYNQPILARNLMREVAQMAPEYKESYLYKEFFKDDLPGFYMPKNYDAEYYAKKGLEAYNENKIEKAIDYFKSAMQQSRSLDYVNYLGMAYIKSSTPKKALECFENILTTDSKYQGAYINLAKYYAEVEKDEKKQMHYLKQAIKINPKNDVPYYMMGNLYFEKGMYETAVEYYKLAISKNDLCFDYYYAQGSSLYKLQDYEQAYLVFKKSLQTELDSPKVYEYLAKSSIELKKYDEAKTYIEKAIELSPSPKYYVELAKILYLQGDYASCMNIANNKLMGTDSSEAYNYIGLCNFQKGDYKNALEAFKNAVNISAKPSYFYNMAVCYKNLSDDVNMQSSITSAVNAIPKSVEDYLDIANVYQDLNQNDKVLETLNKAIISYPNERLLYNLKLQLLQVMGKTAEYNAFNLTFKEKFKKDPIYLRK